jgi:hypothetical protein
MRIPTPGSPGRSRFVELVAGLILGALVLPGAILLLADWGLLADVIGGVLWLASLALTGWLLQRERRRQSVLGALTGPRLLLLFGLAGGLLVRRPDDAGWFWAATGLAAFTVVTEPFLRLTLSNAVPVAAQLPGVRAVPDAPFPPDLIVLTSTAAVAVGAVLAVLAAPGWAYLALTAVAALATVVLAAHGARATVISVRCQPSVRPALERYQPEFVVYYAGKAGKEGATYQLGVWLPYLERVGRRFIVITAEPSLLREVAAMTSAPVLAPQRGSTTATLPQLVVRSLKAAFYVQGSPDNLNLQRFERLTHVWLNHGDSDKKANFSPRHATFDKIFVAGQQGADRYAAHGVKLRPDQLVMVGRPQIERIEAREGAAPVPPRTVLYAPTWLGGRPATSYSSLHLGPRIVDTLLGRGMTVIFRPHPLSHRDPTHARFITEIQRRLDADRRATGRPHVWGPDAETRWDVPDCFNASDALITDVSSLASDFLASGKPLAMVAIREKGNAFRRAIPMARVAYVIEGDLSNLDSALDQLLGLDERLGPDPLADARLAYRTRCLGENLGARASEGFLHAVTALLDQQLSSSTAGRSHPGNDRR